MKKINFENFKTFILITLIISSIFLTGSLWFDNYHGLSLVINKLPFWFNETFDFDKIEYNEYVKPFKVTVTNGDNGNFSYYTFNSGNSKGFELISSVIQKVDENGSLENAFYDEWNELKNRKSVICEFGKGMDIAIINSVISNHIISSDVLTNVSAIAVTKSVNGVILYIKEENNNIYRVSLTTDMPEFTEYINTYSNQIVYAKLLKIEEMGTTTFFGNKKISPDSYALFPVSTKQNNRRQVSKIIKKDFYSTHDINSIERIASTIFSTYEYTKFTTTDNNHIFINDDGSTIKISDMGIIEYTSKAVNEYNDSTIVSSFNIALDFINNISTIENIYLLSAHKSKDLCEFEFGMNVDELPVIDTENKIGSDNRTIIHIKLQNNKVIYYNELLNRYSFEKTSSYISSFGHNILDDVLSNIEKDTTVNIESIDLLYDVSIKDSLPVWFTKYSAYNDKKEYITTPAAKERKY